MDSCLDGGLETYSGGSCICSRSKCSGSLGSTAGNGCPLLRKFSLPCSRRYASRRAALRVLARNAASARSPMKGMIPMPKSNRMLTIILALTEVGSPPSICMHVFMTRIAMSMSKTSPMLSGSVLVHHASWVTRGNLRRDQAQGAAPAETDTTATEESEV